jgi:hypothetical protein
MPTQCCWHECKEKPSKDDGVTIPFAKTRSKYLDINGERVSIGDVMKWRKNWLKAGGLHVKDNLDTEDMRMCRRHVPSAAFKDGVLVFVPGEFDHNTCRVKLQPASPQKTRSHHVASVG